MAESIKLIDAKGIQGFTIKNLSKKIGISEPAIYRHYNNKSHILIAILELFENNAELIFTNELNNDNNAILKIEKLLIKHLTSFSTTPSLVSVFFSEEIFRNEPILINKITKVLNNNDKILTSIISDGQRKGEIRTDLEAKYLSIIIMGTLRLLVKKWHLADNAVKLPIEGQKLIESIKTLII